MRYSDKLSDELLCSIEEYAKHSELERYLVRYLDGNYASGRGKMWSSKSDMRAPLSENLSIDAVRLETMAAQLRVLDRDLSALKQLEPDRSEADALRIAANTCERYELTLDADAQAVGDKVIAALTRLSLVIEDCSSLMAETQDMLTEHGFDLSRADRQLRNAISHGQTSARDDALRMVFSKTDKTLAGFRTTPRQPAFPRFRQVSALLTADMLCSQDVKTVDKTTHYVNELAQLAYDCERTALSKLNDPREL